MHRGAPGRTRTDTVLILSQLPLPLGYGGDAPINATNSRTYSCQPRSQFACGLSVTGLSEAGTLRKIHSEACAERQGH